MGERKKECMREVTFVSKSDEPDKKTLLKETLARCACTVEESEKERLILQPKQEEWKGYFIDVTNNYH